MYACVCVCVLVLSVQVVEMFSSAGDLHLELPSRLKQTNRELWVSFTVCSSVSLSEFQIA